MTEISYVRTVEEIIVNLIYLIQALSTPVYMIFYLYSM